MATVRRSIVKTTADVIDETGAVVGTVEKHGTTSAARMANIARREFKNPLVTVRNLVQEKKTYSMSEADFFKMATLVNDSEGE